MSDRKEAVCGGIDLGGTKIEATLFDAALNPLVSRRVSTPRENYSKLLDTLAGEMAWLAREAYRADLPIGVGIPGFIDPKTGRSLTANLPANGRPFGVDLAAIHPGTIHIENDSKCFTLSEAVGGAGANDDTVFGLIIGTGLGGGVAIKGKLAFGLNRMACEIGHIALPATIVAQYHIPLLQCNCGRFGCFETLVSGTGLAQLASALIGKTASASELFATSNDSDVRRVIDIWLRLVGELLHSIQMHIDPDCIVLGGGLSKIDGLEERFSAALSQATLHGLRAPKICKPKFGDSSGTRGAALLALPNQKRNP